MEVDEVCLMCEVCKVCETGDNVKCRWHRRVAQDNLGKLSTELGSGSRSGA